VITEGDNWVKQLCWGCQQPSWPTWLRVSLVPVLLDRCEAAVMAAVGLLLH